MLPSRALALSGPARAFEIAPPTCIADPDEFRCEQRLDDWWFQERAAEQQRRDFQDQSETQRYEMENERLAAEQAQRAEIEQLRRDMERQKGGD